MGRSSRSPVLAWVGVVLTQFISFTFSIIVLAAIWWYVLGLPAPVVLMYHCSN